MKKFVHIFIHYAGERFTGIWYPSNNATFVSVRSWKCIYANVDDYDRWRAETEVRVTAQFPEDANLVPSIALLDWYGLANPEPNQIWLKLKPLS